MLVVNGYGEELGWRGLLADGLVDRVGEVRAALIVTVVWATWHLPMFWVVEASGRWAGPRSAWVLGLLAGSVVLTRLYVGSGRSVLLVALWHTAFNFTTATTATQGLSAAITSAAVMVAAAVVLRERTTPRPGRSSCRTAQASGCRPPPRRVPHRRAARLGRRCPGYARRASQSSSAGQRPAHCEDTIS